ncbi:MAG TPA: AI-2E family transporter [Parachlamydiaceae bacterium]|nr:AI-2E family transporter [Nitrosopumilus sp.]HEV8052702.1 AI-2E family transporter [Parachlamydiaceae bacterium]
MKNYNIVHSILIIVFTTIVIFITWYAIDILLLTFAAILLAIFLRALKNLIQRVIHVPDSLSMVLVLGVIITIFSLMTILLAPVVSDQIQNLTNDIPSAWDDLKQVLSSTLSLGPISTLYAKMNIQNLLPHGKNFLLQAANLFSTTFGLIGSVLVFLVMGIYFAFDPNAYKVGFIKLISSSKQKKVSNTLDSIADILQWWIIGKIFSMFIVGFLTAIGLWFLNIPMALTLGLIAAILTFIPNIGPIISVIPAILVAFIQSPITVIYVVLLYIVIQIIESYIITPIIQGKIIALPPALVIFSQLIMGLLTGFLGLSLATPLLATLSVIINKFYIKKNTVDDKRSD